MKSKPVTAACGALTLVTALAACSSSAGSATNPSTTSTGTSASSATCSTGTLDGEGSTAQTNAINAWITGYGKACSGAKVNYNPTGSGQGVSNFTQGLVAFAGSDAALDPKKAARVSDRTAFFTLGGVGKPGQLVELDDTAKIFANPADRRTEDYISGRFG